MSTIMPMIHIENAGKLCSECRFKNWNQLTGQGYCTLFGKKIYIKEYECGHALHRCEDCIFAEETYKGHII